MNGRRLTLLASYWLCKFMGAQIVFAVILRIKRKNID
jgi:hypothetical protein